MWISFVLDDGGREKNKKSRKNKRPMFICHQARRLLKATNSRGRKRRGSPVERSERAASASIGVQPLVYTSSKEETEKTARLLPA